MGRCYIPYHVIGRYQVMKKNKKNKPKKSKKRKPVNNMKPIDAQASPASASDTSIDIVMTLKSALEHQQAGDLGLAEQSFHKVLELDPDNSIANQLSGRLAHLKGAH